MKIYKKESQLCVRYLLQKKIYQNILKNYKSLKIKLHVHSLTQKNQLKKENKECKEEIKENKKLKLKLDQSNNLLFKLIPNKLLRNSKKHYQIKVFSLELIIII